MILNGAWQGSRRLVEGEVKLAQGVASLIHQLLGKQQ